MIRYDIILHDLWIMRLVNLENTLAYSFFFVNDILRLLFFLFNLHYDNNFLFLKIYENGEVEEVTVEYAKPFQFLNLGVLAYIGASQALAQISVDDKVILGSGPIGFLLWRGIYWSKQVNFVSCCIVMCLVVLCLIPLGQVWHGIPVGSILLGTWHPSRINTSGDFLRPSSSRCILFLLSLSKTVVSFHHIYDMTLHFMP